MTTGAKRKCLSRTQVCGPTERYVPFVLCNVTDLCSLEIKTMSY